MTIDPRYRAAEARLWRSLHVEPTESWVRLAGIGTSVRIQELGDGPPVLFVHGGSTTGTSWADLAAALPDWRCVLLDRPGTGLSETPPPVRDIHELGAVADRLIPDVLDGLGIICRRQDRAELRRAVPGRPAGDRAWRRPRAVGRRPREIGRLRPLRVRLTAITLEDR